MFEYIFEKRTLKRNKQASFFSNKNSRPKMITSIIISNYDYKQKR